MEDGVPRNFDMTMVHTKWHCESEEKTFLHDKHHCKNFFLCSEQIGTSTDKNSIHELILHENSFNL